MMITFASIPRSGHHVVTSILQDYAKECQLDFSYCEFYCHSNTTHPPHQCTNYPVCDTALVKKTHDFELNPHCNIPEWKEKVEITDERKYLVLYRKEDARQFEAWYRHSKQNNNEDWSDYNDFEEFVKINIHYYKAFKTKWIETSHPNVSSFTYEDFIQRPVTILKQMLAIIYPEHLCNLVKLRKTILKHDVCWKNTMTSEAYETLKEKYSAALAS